LGDIAYALNIGSGIYSETLAGSGINCVTGNNFSKSILESIIEKCTENKILHLNLVLHIRQVKIIIITTLYLNGH